MIEGNKINETVNGREELPSYIMISFLSHGVTPDGGLNYQILYIDADKIPDSFRCKESEEDGRVQASVAIPFELIPPMWKITEGMGCLEFPFNFIYYKGNKVVEWIDSVNEKSLKNVYPDEDDFNLVKRQLSLLRVFANHFPENECIVFKTMSAKPDVLQSLQEWKTMTNEEALFPKKNLTDEVPYFPLLFTHCSDCGKRIIIQIPKNRSNQKKNTYWVCNDCIAEDSAIRNDMDEPFLTDVSDYLFGERDWEESYLIKKMIKTNKRETAFCCLSFLSKR